MSGILLRIEGEVTQPLELTYDDLAAFAADAQVADVSRLDPQRKGDAVRLAAILERAGAKPSGDYLTLHAALDDFHASVPLSEVRDRGLLIYRLAGESLPRKAGGPVRFLILDHAACRTHEIDDCANVKFVDRIELTHGRGQDNRPQDEQQHAALHEKEAE